MRDITTLHGWYSRSTPRDFSLSSASSRDVQSVPASTNSRCKNILLLPIQYSDSIPLLSCHAHCHDWLCYARQNRTLQIFALISNQEPTRSARAAKRPAPPRVTIAMYNPASGVEPIDSRSWPPMGTVISTAKLTTKFIVP